MNKCLHCDNILEINQTDFCCLGCSKAYKIINDNGFKDYYSSRIINPSEPLTKPEEDDNFNTDFKIEEFINNSDNNCHEANLAIQGLHCGACVWLIENLLKKQSGVMLARINLTQRTLKIKWQGDKDYGNNLLSLITKIGYKIIPFDPEIAKKSSDNSENEIFKALAVAGFGAGNIMLFSFALWFNDTLAITGATRQFLHLLSLIIALPTLIYSGKIFFVSAFRSIKMRMPNMDIAISLAIFLASIVSIVQTFRGQENVYFDSVVMLVFFLLIGRYLDFKVRKKAFNIASEFSALQASFGRVEIDNKIRILPAKKLEKDMLLLVAVGEKIACDGIIVEGKSEVDNSLISGESTPEKIGKNSLVFGGAINIGNPIKVRINKPANLGILAEIISLINSIESKKNFYLKISDQFSRYYTPIIHILALATFALWFFYFKSKWDVALMNATAVLIITCPCALALAIPVVQAIAVSNFLKKGIIIKNGQALEIIDNIEYIIFDKTGSLTCGTPQFQNIYQIIDDKFIELSPNHQEFYLAIAQELAKFSKHALSQSLSNLDLKRLQNNLNINTIKEHAGQGLEAILNNKIIKFGHADFCDIKSVNENKIMENIFAITNANLKCFLNYDDQKFIITFKDEIKQDAKQVIDFLQKIGKKIILLSGDNQQEVLRIANICGIKQYYWRKNPIEKTQILEQLRQKNIKFMMIGDGLNDAPSLALSDISLSFSRAVDISQNIADIIINSNKLSPIIDVFNYSKKALLLMRQNLFLAVIYNIIAVPFAILGYIVPLLAALAMSSSSLLVIINSLRMNYKNN